MPKVIIEDTEHDVPLEAIQLGDGQRIISHEELAENFIPVEQTTGENAKWVSKASFDKRFQNSVSRQAAIDDDEIVQAVLEKHAPDEGGVDLKTAKEQWADEELKPVKGQLEKATAQLQTFEESVVASAIDAAASKVWQPAFASAPKGRQSWAQVNFHDEFAWLPEAGAVVAVIRGDDGSVRPRPPLDPEEGDYMTPLERMRQLAAKDDWKPFARAPETITTDEGARPRGGGGGGKTKRRSEMSPKEISDYVEEYGSEAFRQLPP